jgi:nitroreductase
MELFEAIHGRRSIRQFKPGTVDDAVMRRILRAAMAAPSASNEQPWHFLIIRDAEMLAALSEAHTYAQMVAHAAAAIIVCADMSLVKHRDYWPHDCAAATQNILLAVHAEGLGSVWVGVYPRESRMAEVRSVVPLPEHVHPFCILPIGIPGETKGPEDRFKSTRIHEGQW